MEPSQYKFLARLHDHEVLLQYLNHSFSVSDLGNQEEGRRGRSDRKHFISNMLWREALGLSELAAC